MKTFISVEDFLSLSKGDKLCGHGETFEIKTANCGGPGKYPTHFTSREMNGGKQGDFIFHDGENIRYLCPDDKESDGCIVGSLIDDGNCRIIKKDLLVKK